MLTDVRAFEWVRLLASLILFMGPGLVLISFFFPKFPSANQRVSTLSMGFAFSISFWAVLLLWLRLINFSITPASAWVISLGGWAFLAFRYFKQRQREPAHSLLPDRFGYLVLSLFVVSNLVLLWGIRHEVAGLGSDSFHHTLIAEMIFERGQIPNDYLPYAPIITFSYHYGFHAFIAVLGWLSGWPIRLLVLVSGPVLVGMTGLAVGLLVGKITRSQVAEVFSFVVVAFLAVFPAYMLSWGRYSQLLGTLILLIFLFTFIQWQEEKFVLWKAAWPALLAAGLTLTHYRVTIMCVLGLAAYILIEFLFNSSLRERIRATIFSWGFVLILGLVLVAPWLYGTYTSHLEGMAVIHEIAADSSFYSPARLGPEVNQYPSNLPLFIISFVGIVLGIYKKERFVLWMILWWGGMLLVSSPQFLAGYMDRITVFISFFVPVGLLSGYAITRLAEQKGQTPLVRSGLLLLIGSILVWGSFLSIRTASQPGRSYVSAVDLEVMDWIKTNTPADSVFMVNTFAFPFAEEFIIGSDAGYWLPILANRRTVVPPMSYQNERLSSVDMIKNLVLLHRLNGHLVTDEAVALLRANSVSYIYIGSRGDLIQVNELLESSNYKLEHQHDSNYIFRLISDSDVTVNQGS